MKSVLISIHPKWVAKIASGEKTIEVRKTAPKETPFKCYIYCTSSNVHDCILVDKSGLSLTYAINYKTAIVNGGEIGNGKVIGEFVCDKVERFSVGSFRSDDIEKLACLSYNEMINYFYKPEELDGKTIKQVFAWHISDLKIYDKPRELSEFHKCNFNSMNGTEVCGNYHCKYYQDSSSYMIPPSCAKLGNRVFRPPQSFMYIEEVKQ